MTIRDGIQETPGSERLPYLLYGTAWKEDQTRALTELALKTGFRGIDTANQRKHYFESAVGEALVAAFESGIVHRDELFVQTKFTFRGGQDHRLPYDPSASIAEQVRQSLASSREHLQIDVIDSYVLHGPSRRIGLGPDDWEAWRTMEELCDAGHVRLIGASNVTLDQLKTLCQGSRIRPTFVQNRCFAVNGWDLAIRRFCREEGIRYQGFSLLTANPFVLSQPEVLQIARSHARTPIQIVFRFAVEVGMLPLTGTTDQAHMKADLDVINFQLSPEEVELIEAIALNDL